jgi:YbbR domain-containing protein
MIKKVTKVVFNNFAYKLLAMVLALVLWGIVQGEQIQEVNREITVLLQVPDGFMVRGETVLTKAATIRGPRVLMLEAPSNLEAHINVPAKVGKFKARLDKDALRGWNDRLQLTIHDPFLSIIVDEKVTRTVPIKEVLQGVPAEGVIIEKVTLKPRTVDITGMKSELIKIKHIATEPIDISGLQQSKTIEVPLVPLGIPPENLSETVTQAAIQLGDSKVNKRFGAIPIETVGSDFATRVKPGYVTIVVQGTPGILNFTKRSDFKAFVEVGNIGVGRHELDVKVKIPPDTVLIETFPEKVGVVILPKRGGD